MTWQVIWDAETGGSKSHMEHTLEHHGMLWSKLCRATWHRRATWHARSTKGQQGRRRLAWVYLAAYTCLQVLPNPLHIQEGCYGYKRAVMDLHLIISTVQAAPRT